MKKVFEPKNDCLKKLLASEVTKMHSVTPLPMQPLQCGATYLGKCKAEPPMINFEPQQINARKGEAELCVASQNTRIPNA